MITKKKLFGYFLFIFVVVILPPALDHGISYYIKQTKQVPKIFTKYDPEDTARKVHKRYTKDILTWESTWFGESKNTGSYAAIIRDLRGFLYGKKYLKNDHAKNQQEFGGYFDYYGLKTLLGYYDRCYLIVYFDNYQFSTSKNWCTLRNFFSNKNKGEQDVF